MSLRSKSTVRWDGGVLRKLESDVSQVVRETAEQAEADAKRTAPVLTGELRDSIEAGRVNTFNYELKAEAEHASFVEFGTSRMRAQPFFIPALVRAKRYFETELRKLLR